MKNSRRDEEQDYLNPHHIARKRKNQAFNERAKTPKDKRSFVEDQIDEDDDPEKYARFLK